MFLARGLLNCVDVLWGSNSPSCVGCFIGVCVDAMRALVERAGS